MAIILPLIHIIVGIGLTFGVGSASYISRMLGAGNRELASKTASLAIFYCFSASGTLVLSVCFSVEANEVLLNHVENVCLSTVAFTCASVASQISSAVIVFIIPFISHPFLPAIVTVPIANTPYQL